MVKALKQGFSLSHLLLGLEDVTAEHVTLSISGNVAEDLQILGVMRHIEDPEREWKKNPSEIKKEKVNDVQNNNKTLQPSKMHHKKQSRKRAHFSECDQNKHDIGEAPNCIL